MTGLIDQTLDDASALPAKMSGVHEAASWADRQPPPGQFSSADVPSADVPSADVPSADVPSADVPSAELLGLAMRAKRLYHERRRRAAVFGGDDVLFGEPAWDILLDLFMAWSERRTVRIGDACVAAAVPKTTALRWLETLAQHCLIERTNDRSDARSGIVRLTARGVDVMRTYLGQLT